jgi:hypothetical protein
MLRIDRFAVRTALALLLLAAASGCATQRLAPRVHLPQEELWKLYAQAVAETKMPVSAHLSRSLTALTNSTQGLQWNGQGQVLMATWTQASYWQGATPGQPFTLSNHDVWLSPSPFLQQFCRQLRLPPNLLKLRLAQKLGMPPNSTNDTVVSMWVSPSQIFRPCPDPEVNDGECVVDLTAGPADPSPPSLCPWQDAIDKGQVSGTWTKVTAEHLLWMCKNWTSSYTGNPQTSYPWTALGYTWDWGGPKSHIGESEYIVPGGATVTIEAVTPVETYCTASTSR